MNDLKHALRADRLDRVIHERARLAIMSALAPVGELSFTELKAAVQLTDGNLSVHLRLLEEAGYVEIRKSFVGRRPRTDARIAPAGKRAFQKYLDVLEDLVRRGRP